MGGWGDRGSREGCWVSLMVLVWFGLKGGVGAKREILGFI